ncbi:DEAD/DEAH box helicase [Moheibacter stercoris]
MDVQSILEKLQIQDLNQMQKSTYSQSDNHQDIILLSPTGSGKTLAFLFPLLRNLSPQNSGIQALIMVPSRELALQIEQVFKAMATDYKVSVVYGGHDKKIEQNNLIESPAVLIGTPGRIAYHVKNQNIDASTIQTLVLDEFDKSLEFGFQDDMTYIIESMSNLNHRILTSATSMSTIPSFAGLENVKTLDFLKELESKPNFQFRKVNTLSEEKLETLFKLICKIGSKRTLIFCNHRDAVDRISELLRRKGIERENFHGGLEQDERERALFKFRNDSVRILITTDLAARGLDIPEVESIVHYQLPPKEDAFIHRNGRTARMNAKGFVYVMISEDENFPFIDSKILVEDVEGFTKVPQNSPWQTIYISAGKKDKVNKVDIVGFLIKKGGLTKEEVGLIEVKDTTSYVAIPRKKAMDLVKKLDKERIKNKKVKLDIAR